MLAAPAEAAVVEEPPKAPTPPPPAGNANIYALLLAWSCFKHSESRRDATTGLHKKRSSSKNKWPPSEMCVNDSQLINRTKENE